jgi:protein-tyrosine phosphatase
MFSVAIVVAYLMKKHRMSLESAMSLVRSKRPHVGPNEGFMSQLENFENSLQGITQIAIIILLSFRCLVCFRES